MGQDDLKKVPSMICPCRDTDPYTLRPRPRAPADISNLVRIIVRDLSADGLNQMTLGRQNGGWEVDLAVQVIEDEGALRLANWASGLEVDPFHLSITGRSQKAYSSSLNTCLEKLLGAPGEGMALSTSKSYSHPLSSPGE